MLANLAYAVSVLSLGILFFCPSHRLHRLHRHFIEIFNFIKLYDNNMLIKCCLFHHLL